MVQLDLPMTKAGFRVWALRARALIATAELPTDPPRVHAGGPNPDRVLLFGSDIFMGGGVLSHEVAFPGQLARAVARSTQRGVDVHVESHSALKMGAAIAEARLLDLSRYDAVMIDLGLADALADTSGSQWESHLEVLLQVITSGIPASAHVFFIGSPDPTIVPLFRSRGGRRVARSFLEYNARSANVAAHFPNVSFLAFEVEPEPESDRLHTARTFQRFAATLAPALIMHLETEFVLGAPRPAPIADEAKRQASLDGLRILDTEAEERFDRIVRQAQRIFGTQYASFNLIDRDRRWTKSRAGLPGAAEGERATQFCNTTIHEHSALVVGDLSADPRFADNALVVAEPHLRYYVGYPIEAPDGQRVGSLCVYDSVPHRLLGNEEQLMRDLAKKVERELWFTPETAQQPALSNSGRTQAP